MTSSPYIGLPDSSYWKTAVTQVNPLAPVGIYQKKYEILKTDKIAAAGSCFAQHITRKMQERQGFSVMQCELPPPSLSPNQAALFGYNQYTCRYGNVYTARQMVQLIKEAYGLVENPEPVWERDGRFFDSMRPTMEPGGLASSKEVIALREYHLACVREMIESMDILVFTMGLTETWMHKETEWVFPTAPGTVAGKFNSVDYEFVNFDYTTVRADMMQLIEIIQRFNRSDNFRMLVTVSPVPLTATYEKQHVLSATVYSKSVLRSVAGSLEKELPFLDYFPSYELVSSHWSRGVFFQSNLRSVDPAGVDVVMKAFFSEHGSSRAVSTSVSQPSDGSVVELDDGVQCEDALLEAFVK